MYQFVNMITCDIIDPTSPNSVFGLFMGRSRMNSYLGHLDLVSSSLLKVNSMYQLVNAIT